MAIGGASGFACAFLRNWNIALGTLSGLACARFAHFPLLGVWVNCSMNLFYKPGNPVRGSK